MTKPARQVECPTCRGHGAEVDGTYPCTQCRGSGKIRRRGRATVDEPLSIGALRDKINRPRKPGRPPLGDKARSVVVTIKLTPAEAERWRAKAGKTPLSEWIRHRCNR